jgi:hypothetical protein
VSNAVAPAIVIAGALIALGLFMGLRTRSAPERLPLRPVNPALARANTERLALAQLEHYRPELVEKCWKPTLAVPESARARMKLDVTFGPDGAQLARGLLEERGASRSDVTACVQETLPALRISPQGLSVRVELPLALP